MSIIKSGVFGRNAKQQTIITIEVNNDIDTLEIEKDIDDYFVKMDIISYQFTGMTEVDDSLYLTYLVGR